MRHPRFFARQAIVLICVGVFWLGQPRVALAQANEDAEVKKLAAEVSGLGWIGFGARSEKGDWDLHVCRPDGSNVRRLTSTPEFSEFSPQFSRAGWRLLYRRVPRSEVIDNNHHGMQGQLMLARSDGSHAEAFGKAGEFPWASWSPDGKQIATLSITGVCIVELATHKTVRTIPRKGFFQQVTWSPDGQWLCGVANSFGTGWSIARMQVATGEIEAVNRVDCCTPDWFPDSHQIIFSWRPQGQKANKGYGWTQLWMAGADGKSRKLLYAEEGRHVYGGNVSPDGRYAIFTGNMKEDGDPGGAGGPMGLMRIADAPIVGGGEGEARSLHPDAAHGPVVVLPAGWEPCWTASDPFAEQAAAEPDVRGTTGEIRDAAASDAGLSTELATKGLLVFSARTEAGDWDLFTCRPDGSERRPFTQTPEYNEAGARFSRDGAALMYYRMPVREAVDNNTYGTYDLVVCDLKSHRTEVLGKDFPWASWGPTGDQIACLTPKGVNIVSLKTRQVVSSFSRKGIVQQLTWAPDGQAFVGTANGLGPFWNVARLDAAGREINAVSETDRYNCTPDWFPDSRHIVYSRGIIPNAGGRAELWSAAADGTERRTLFAEEDRHIYGGCISPDGTYALFTRSVEDLGHVDNSRTTMAVMRLSDAPIALGTTTRFQEAHPGAHSKPWLDLGPGWEPHWTPRTDLRN